MTIPNLLTCFRILLTPFLIWSLLESRLNHALFIFTVAGMTDGLDGLIARLFHQKSRLGAYLDPLADKLLLVSCFVLLAYLDLVPDWLAALAISRDVVIVAGLMALMFYHAPVQIKPALLSKLTTLMQLFTILITLLGFSYWPMPIWFNSLVFGTTAVLCVASGVHYVMLGISILEVHRCHQSGR